MISKKIEHKNENINQKLTYGLLISMAMMNGDWNNDIAHKQPTTDMTENQVKFDVVNMIATRPRTIDETLT